MAYGAGEADMAAAWEQYLQNHNVNHQLQLQDILRETEPPTESKKKEGAGKRKTKRNRTILPRLRKVSYKNKKHRYRLKDPFRKRKKAIHEGVKMEAEMKGRSIKKAAIAKKGRFNVLRIYRRNKKIKECNTITHDMRYMDKKYGLGKTKNICGQKGGTNESLLNPAQSTFRNLQELKAILNFYNSNKIIFKSWNGDETEHELKPEQDSNTHLLIVGADYGIPFTLLENPNSDKIKPKGYVNYLTYVSAQQGGARKKKGGRRKTRKTRKRKSRKKRR